MWIAGNRSVWAMGQLSLLLLLTLSLTSAFFGAAPTFYQIFMDASNCVHLRCEWRGVGGQCKPPPTVQKVVSGYYFKFLDAEETDDELLARIKARHPVNRFTIVKNVALGELCGRKRLWCNAAQQFFSENVYEEFLVHLLGPIPLELRPKLHC